MFEFAYLACFMPVLRKFVSDGQFVTADYVVIEAAWEVTPVTVTPGQFTLYAVLMLPLLR